MTQVVMHPALAQALQALASGIALPPRFRLSVCVKKVEGEDSSFSGCGQDYLHPAAVKAGVIPKDHKGRFGWDNLRHSLANFFAANEVNLPVIQSILRRSKPSTTALYTHRVNAAQMAAQAKFLDAIKVTSAAV